MQMRQVHRWLAPLAFIFLLFVSATGVWLQFEQLGKEERSDTVAKAGLDLRLVSETAFGQAISHAAVSAPADARLTSIEARRDGGRPMILVHFAQVENDGDSDATGTIIVDAASGQVVRVEPPQDEGFVRRLHSGEVFGEPGVVLGVFWGTALLCLTVTGLWMYLQMYTKRRGLGRKGMFWTLLLSGSLLGLPSDRAFATDDAFLSAFSGNVLLTANASTLDNPRPSLNEKLTLDYALPGKQVLDLRVENYYESSFNTQPPGVLTHNINEHKFEAQATYTRPLFSIFSGALAVLHHENFTIPDTYAWGIATLTAAIPLGDSLSLTANVSLEKRLSGGRFFYDTSTTLDYGFADRWTFEVNYHRYENFGQFDAKPTQKQEYEIGLIHNVADKWTVAASFFRHVQFGAPNDQFSFVKLRLGYSF